jgi:hypothetical protein
MTKLDDRLRGLDQVDVPDVWRIARDRRAAEAGRRSDVDLSPNRDLSRRLAAAITAFVVFGAAALFAWRAFDGQEGATTVGTAPSEDTYVFTDLRIGPESTSQMQGVGEQVEVQVDTRWTGDIYPGTATCTIQVRDGGGMVIGTWTDDWSQLRREGSVPVDVPIEAGSDATTAEGSCEPGVPPTGDYVFSQYRIGAGVATAVISWGSADPPGAAWCEATFGQPTGSAVSRTFSLLTSEQSRVDWSYDLSGELAQSDSVAVRCVPYTDQAADAAPSDASAAPTIASNGVVIAVLNGTNNMGLAGLTTQRLLVDGYVEGQIPADAPNKPVERTIVYFVGGPQADRNRAEAASIATMYFGGARTEELPADLASMIDQDVQVVIIAGEDAVP